MSLRRFAWLALAGLVACSPTGPAPTTSPDVTAASTFAGRSWREVAVMPEPRSHLSAVALNGALFTIGGAPRGGGSSLGFDRYEPSTNTWTSLAALPVGTDHSAAAAVGSSIFVFGGSFDQPSTRAYRIDLPPADAQTAGFAAVRWRPIAPLPEPRSAAGAAVVGDRIYLVGGFDASRREIKSSYVYDIAGDVWRGIADLPTPWEHLAVADHNGHVCALSGHVGNAIAMSTVECYDPAADRWSTGIPLPKPASDFAATFFEGAIWTAGDDVQIFDGTRWWLGPPLSIPRYGVAVAAVDGSLYVIGGAPREPAPDGVVERIDLR